MAGHQSIFIVIWEYRVRVEKRSAFEEIYSASGAWAELFRKGAGYIGTELMHSTEYPEQYITIDRWETKADYESFLSQWKNEYETLDTQCEGLTEQESCLGRFASKLS